MARRKLLLPDAVAIRERVDREGLIQVRVTPNASADEVILSDGDSTHLLAIRTTATPEHGKANEAVLRLLAEVARSDRVIAGSGARGDEQEQACQDRRRGMMADARSMTFACR